MKHKTYKYSKHLDVLALVLGGCVLAGAGARSGSGLDSGNAVVGGSTAGHVVTIVTLANLIKSADLAHFHDDYVQDRPARRARRANYVTPPPPPMRLFWKGAHLLYTTVPEAQKS